MKNSAVQKLCIIKNIKNIKYIVIMINIYYYNNNIIIIIIIVVLHSVYSKFDFPSVLFVLNNVRVAHVSSWLTGRKEAIIYLSIVL